jgi:hypothetical protein
MNQCVIFTSPVIALGNRVIDDLRLLLILPQSLVGTAIQVTAHAKGDEQYQGGC